MPVLTEPTADFVTQRAFWQIHGVCDSKNNQPAVSQAWPIEEIVHDGLVLSDQLIQFIHKDDTRHPTGAWSGEFSLK